MRKISIIITCIIFCFQVKAQTTSTLEVVGTAELSVKPSLAIITLNISTIQIGYTDAVDELSRRINILNESLVKKGVMVSLTLRLLLKTSLILTCTWNTAATRLSSKF